MILPNQIFFTGVPGSRWSGIAQTLESMPYFNTTDRTREREYHHGRFTGHKGAYFGRQMEFEATLDADYINSAWAPKSVGTKLVKSHDWAYSLDQIKYTFPNDWIMLVYRDNAVSFSWWKEAGGWNIKYPSYIAYQNDVVMTREIAWQNSAIRNFAERQGLIWANFDSTWVKEHFDMDVKVEQPCSDIFVTILK
jgi:hypothetical protein